MGEDPQTIAPDPTEPTTTDAPGQPAVWKVVKIRGQERPITEDQAIRAVQRVGDAEAIYEQGRAGLGILQALTQDPAATLVELANRTGVDLNQLVNPTGRTTYTNPMEDDDMDTTPDTQDTLAIRQELAQLKDHLAVRDAEQRISREMDQIKAKNPHVDMPALLDFAAREGFTSLAAAYKVFDYDRLEQEAKQIREARPATLPTAGTRLSSSLLGGYGKETVPGADKYRAKVTTADAFTKALEKLRANAQ